jgi:hypothetical protein
MAKLRDVRLAVHLPLRNRCHEDYEAMTPVTGGRACAACQHVVHDLSAMREREAARFVAEHAGQRVCMRYLARADGTIVYREEPSRMGAAALAVALAACTPHEPPPQIAGEVEVVEVAAPMPVAVVVPEAPEAAVVEPPEAAVVEPPEATVVEPPDDDINPCAPDPTAEPGAAKKAPKPKPRPRQGAGQAAAKAKVEYLGFL